ncbi:MAG TPA: OsmC family protein [Chryseosolibacter sp.]
MTIEARLENSGATHHVLVSTNAAAKQLAVPAKNEGRGSAINGGEFLATAIATCFCNDIYREAIRRKIEVRSITVHVTSIFGGEGDPAKEIVYSVKIDSPASESEINKLIHDVDKIAEIHNTLRRGIDVTLRV